MGSSTVVVPKPPTKIAQGFVLADFIKSRKTGLRSKTDAYDNIRSVSMVFAAVKAVRTGRRVPVLDKPTLDLLKKTPRQ